MSLFEVLILLALLAAFSVVLYRHRKVVAELEQFRSLSYVYIPKELSREILNRACDLVAEVEQLEKGGEYKKFQTVLSKLMKEYPDVPKRHLAFAIEVGVQWL